MHKNDENRFIREHFAKQANLLRRLSEHSQDVERDESTRFTTVVLAMEISGSVCADFIMTLENISTQ